jgi:hypothetical protein
VIDERYPMTRGGLPITPKVQYERARSRRDGRHPALIEGTTVSPLAWAPGGRCVFSYGPEVRARDAWSTAIVSYISAQLS